jgi:hypothetical protein
MDVTVNDLFRLCREYEPQGVGIEITGQQQGFIQWIENEMHYRDFYFNLTTHNGKRGIRPATDKLSRFNMVVPLFKAGKIAFASELRDTQMFGIFVEQIALATKDGIKGKDDCIDTVSMLQYMYPWKPNVPEVIVQEEQRDTLLWGTVDSHNDGTSDTAMGSYVV